MTRTGARRDNLPQDQWRCIWCDGEPPLKTFASREHIVAESLGGERDYRLPRGTVCDACNKGVLQRIDEEMQLLGPVRILRTQFGLGRDVRELAQGITFDWEANAFTVDATKLRNGNAASFEPATGTIKTRVAGPSASAKTAHMTRGLHRIAYNVLAHARGASVARSEYAFLRDLVLDLDAIRERAFVCDARGLLPALRRQATVQGRRRWKSVAEPLAPLKSPKLVRISIGPVLFYVSVTPSTTPLLRFVSPDRGVSTYSAIETGR